MAHRQVDGIAGEDFARQVHQHAVAQLAGVKEPDERDRNGPRAAEVFEHALASETAHGVFANRLRRIRFTRAPAAQGRQPVNGARGKGNNSTGSVFPAHDTGQVGVHRPGARRIFGGTELQSGQIDHVGGSRQLCNRGFIEQVATNGFDALRLQPGLFVRD